MAEELVSIKSINVKNYKSIIDLTIQLGTFNVLIGANGCGKSNILEAIALGAAASADKLDFEYFGNRGIRIVKSQMMLPAFEGVDANGVNLSLSDSKNNTHSFYIYFDQNAKPAKWKAVFNTESIDLEQIKKMMKENGISEKYTLKVVNNDDYYERFMILSAVESIIRRSDDSNKTYPLGLHGEGLFAYLKELSQRTNSESFFNELKENLTVFDWFDDIKIPKNQLSNEFNISLKDNYLDETLNVFDQNSTNEGFLYLLFYLTLIISDETPKFFAIENIDSSFNPKLCREVIRRLIILAKKHGKQIIATTHNPSVLDGLDLEDDDVRLYTIRRTIDGDTKASRVTLKSKLTIPLSEAWQRGYIGGLPDNF